MDRVASLPFGSLPRHAPSLRFVLDGVADDPPAFAGDALFVRRRPTGVRAPVLTVHDRLDGAERAQLFLPETPGAWTGPRAADDGSIAILGWTPHDGTGIALHVFARGSTATITTGFRYALSGGPDWYPGPGAMLPPVPAGEGRWVVCAAESGHDASPWQLAALSREARAPLWTGEGFLRGVARGIAVVSGRTGFSGIDVARGALAWSADTREEAESSVASEGVLATLAGDGRRAIELDVLDVATGARRFRHVFPHRRDGLAPGDVAAAKSAVVVRSGHDERLHVFTPDGDPIATREVRAHALLAFDGVQIVVWLDDRRLACGPASDPGAWAWILELPDDRPGYLQVGASDGQLWLSRLGDSRLHVYAIE